MEALQEVVVSLEHSLAKVNVEMVKKLNQIKNLSKKLAEVQDGKGWKGEPNPNKHLRNDPINDFDNQAQILPDEVWEIVFDELSDSDWSNLLNTCSFFQKILSPRSPTFLFPKIFPDLWKHLEGGEILRCREVCKAWSYGVDHFLENHRSLRPHDDENCDPRDLPFVSPMEEKRLHTPSSVLQKNIHTYSVTYLPEKRAETLPDCNRNPFIGRAVEINNWSYGETEEVLKLYGQHIWYLTVNTDWRWDCVPGCNCFGTFEHVYLVLRNPPPNLRKLRIINAEDEPFFERRNLWQYPPLDNLETLHFDTSPRAIHKGLSESYHLQLRRVHMRAVHWISVFNLGWPALVELHLQDLSTNDDHYDSLINAEMPNLRKLGCGSREDDCDSKDMLDQMLKIITNLSEITQLSTVRFNEHISMGCNAHSMEELRDHAPPSLKTLEMEHFCDFENDLTNYSFLLHFPFLENINVYWRGVDEFKDRDNECDTISIDSTISSYGWSGAGQSDDEREYSPVLESEPGCTNQNDDGREYSLVLESEPGCTNQSDDGREYSPVLESEPGCTNQNDDESEYSCVLESEPGCTNQSDDGREYSPILESEPGCTNQNDDEREYSPVLDCELVQVNRYINRKELYKSNIWELLPRLKVLTLQLDLYTREGYDNFKKWNKGNNVP